MTAVLPLTKAPPAPPPAALVSHCANCGELVAVLPGTCAHLAEACKECFGTGQPCPYPDLHGTQRRCPGAEAVECAWCRRVLEATPDAALRACPDHRDPCCGCCQPG